MRDGPFVVVVIRQCLVAEITLHLGHTVDGHGGLRGRLAADDTVTSGPLFFFLVAREDRDTHRARTEARPG